MSVVVISTATFVLSTMPELTDNIDIMLFDNETENALNSTEVPLMAPVERWEEVGYEKFKMEMHRFCICCLYTFKVYCTTEGYCRPLHYCVTVKSY